MMQIFIKLLTLNLLMTDHIKSNWQNYQKLKYIGRKCKYLSFSWGKIMCCSKDNRIIFCLINVCSRLELKRIKVNVSFLLYLKTLCILSVLSLFAFQQSRKKEKENKIILKENTISNSIIFSFGYILAALRRKDWQ